MVGFMAMKRRDLVNLWDTLKREWEKNNASCTVRTGSCGRNQGNITPSGSIIFVIYCQFLKIFSHGRWLNLTDVWVVEGNTAVIIVYAQFLNCRRKAYFVYQWKYSNSFIAVMFCILHLIVFLNHGISYLHMITDIPNAVSDSDESRLKEESTHSVKVTNLCLAGSVNPVVWHC